jgi:3-hydroxybutyryl-CoA dehydrogenase
MAAIETLAIAGSGVIATGLAASAARSPGHVLWARSETSATRATASVAKSCERLGEAYCPSNVRVTTDLGDLGLGSFVVESITEDLALKSALLGRLQKVVRPDAILSSTTSSLSVQLLEKAAGRPHAFAGFHVFNPVPKMRLVEIAFPPKVTRETPERTRALCVGLDKEPVEVPAILGFVVNCLLFPYLFSAVDYMERTGLAPEVIDSCMELSAGHPMGPVALLDYIGLDVSLAIGDALDCAVPERIRSLVAQGATGRKAGRGLYPSNHYQPCGRT